MQIKLFYFEGCPAFEQTVSNLKEALLLEGVSAAPEIVTVTSEKDAQRKRFIGSPTIRIDGIDLEGPEAESKGYGFGCRVYPSDDGLQRVPPVDLIRAALRRQSR